MSNAIQYIVVGLVVTAAGAYVGRYAWQLLRGKSGGRCSGCSACAPPKTVVSIQSREPGTSEAESP